MLVAFLCQVIQTYLHLPRASSTIFMYVCMIYLHACYIHKHIDVNYTDTCTETIRGLMGHILMDSICLVVQEMRTGFIARFLNSIILLLFLKFVVHTIVTLGFKFLFSK